MDNLILYAWLKNHFGGGGGGSLPENVVTDEKLKTALAKLSKGIHLFSQSSISSTFSGPSGILQKEDLLSKDEEVTANDLAIFPDDKTLVLYLGRITEINDTYYTVSNIQYLKDNWIFSGDWQQGINASYPEIYKFEGGLWLCLLSDVTNPPHEEEDQDVGEWKLLVSSGTDIPVLEITEDDLSDDGESWSEAGLEKINKIFALAAPIIEILMPGQPNGSFYCIKTTIATESIYISMQTNFMQYPDDEFMIFIITKTKLQNTTYKRWYRIPRPTFYKVDGDVLTDTGGVGTTYLVSPTNLIPSDITPEQQDIIIFYTDLAYYIGEVNQVSSSSGGLTVEVKQQLGLNIPAPTEEDEGKILGVINGKIGYIAQPAAAAE